MISNDDINEVIADITRAANAACRTTDYFLLRLIIDSCKEVRAAYDKQDVFNVNYLMNKTFWNIRGSKYD